MKPRRLLLQQDSSRVIPNTTTAVCQVDSSSMALTALVLVSALFFLAFFSFFARRFLSPTHQPSSSLPLPLTHPNRLPRAACLGVDAATLKAMPVMRFSGGEAWCVVCLGGLEEEERVKVIPGCGHVFHPACIDAWLGRHGSCPLCRCSEIVVGFGDGGGDGGGEVEEKRIGRSRSGEWTRIERMVFLRRTCSF